MILSKYFMIISLAIFTSSCATFSKAEFKNEYTKLNSGNLSNLNGKYSFYPTSGYGEKNMDIALNPDIHVNLYQEITTINPLNDQCIDSINGKKSDCHIEIKLITPDSIMISTINNGTTINSATYGGKLKNDMFLIENIQRKSKGIPYLHGYFFNSKRRIVLSADNNLITNEVLSTERTKFIFMTNGYSTNSAFKFERIE